MKPDLLNRWLAPLLTVSLLVLALYGTVLVYAAGEALLAGTLVMIIGLAVWVYASPRTYAYRYLFPGIAAVLVFVVFPMVYTISIGFTNYSTKNLLEFPRATQYFLDETYQAEGEPYSFSIHADSGAGAGATSYRLRLESESGRSFTTPALALVNTEPHDIKLESGSAIEGASVEPLPMKDVIGLQARLKALSLILPDGSKVKMTGLRQFGPVAALYEKQADGRLQNKKSGETIKPNFETGFYEAADGAQLSPGFKVGVGWSNYVRIFTDAAFSGPFFQIFLWTIGFASLTMVFVVSLGMLLAVLFCWDAMRYTWLYRTLLFLPYAVPGFISILVFKGLFNNNFGEINLILGTLFGIRPAWFSDPLLAKAMLLIVNVWLGYPYFMVVCMGLIKAIPADLYEASAVAGAGPLTNFFRITLPLIIRPLTPLIIAAFAFNFNNFVLIALLTGGRPDFLGTTVPAGTTDLLVSYTYRIAFQDSGQQYGLAAAISTVIFLLVAAIAVVQMRFTKIAQQEIR